MIFDTETRSSIAQAHAAREAELDQLNRQRLEGWAMRYPYDLVEVPAPINHDGWPPTCRTETGFVLRPPSSPVIPFKKRGRG